ncbi:glucosaminidase domain-containing protein [Thalassotalea aquiviva]|uniref:glucosaminidase domain-containing protein n=1 Tax=Thalassotalea aquiviva TaxID=3242415 RepID=UPI00352B6B09
MFKILVKFVAAAFFAYMLVAPFLYQSESEIRASKGTIKSKAQQGLAKHNVDLPDFGAIKDPNEKKSRFFNFIKPAIEAQNARILTFRAQLIKIQQLLDDGKALSAPQQLALTQLADTYSVSPSLDKQQQVRQLLTRVDAIPTELVLVQAANESAWGSSRFARLGLNFFGMWCFKKGCGLVPQGRESGLNHEVAAFKSVDQMVARYFLNINTHNAYALFRQIRVDLRENNIELQADILATGLLPYSERGMDYIVEINTMLRHNARFIKT